MNKDNSLNSASRAAGGAALLGSNRECVLVMDKLVVNYGKFSHSYKLMRSIWNQVSVSRKTGFVCLFPLQHFPAAYTEALPLSAQLLLLQWQNVRFSAVSLSNLSSLHYTAGRGPFFNCNLIHTLD